MAQVTARKFWGIGRGPTRKPGRPWRFRSKRVYSRKSPPLSKYSQLMLLAEDRRRWRAIREAKLRGHAIEFDESAWKDARPGTNQ